MSEDKLEIVDSVKMQPLPVCCLLSLPKLEHAMPQLPRECTRVSLAEPESFMPLNRGDPKACAGGHSPDASIPAFGKLEMLTSEACPKNYVVFDHCEGKNTVIFNPSWLNSPSYYSSPQSCFAHEATHFLSGIHAHNCKPIEAKLEICSLAASNTAGLEVPVYSEAVAIQPRQMTSSIEVQNLKKGILKAADFLSDIEEVSHDEFHENSEEIDALLSSDDELSSTGHTLSVASSNCLTGAKNDHGNEIFGKKRKFLCSTLDALDDDGDSGPSKLAPDHTYLHSKRLGSFMECNFRDMEGKSSVFSDIFAEEGECVQKQSAGTIRGVSADSSTRINIKHKVQQLRNVVPCGDCLDTTGVLGHSIQYVKSLQSRLRELEAEVDFHMPKERSSWV